MMILVCGGRKFNDKTLLEGFLDRLYYTQHTKGDSITHLIHGAAEGADTLADAWARLRGVQPVACAALWDRFPKQGPDNAGMRRNQAMLLLRPNVVIAFPGGTGTGNMVERTKRLIRSTVFPPSATSLVKPILYEVDFDGKYSQFPVVR